MIPMQDLLEKVAELYSDPNTWAGFGGAAAMVVTIIILGKLKRKGLLPNKLECKIKKATKLGHVAVGRCVASHNYNRNKAGGRRNMTYSATYEFCVEGKLYQTTATIYRNRLPETTTIYYLNSPKRAFTAYDPHPAGLLPLFLVVICLMVCYITALLLGFDPQKVVG